MQVYHGTSADHVERGFEKLRRAVDISSENDLLRISCDDLHDLHLAALTTQYGEREAALEGLQKGLRLSKEIGYKAAQVRPLHVGYESVTPFSCTVVYTSVANQSPTGYTSFIRRLPDGYRCGCRWRLAWGGCRRTWAVRHLRKTSLWPRPRCSRGSRWLRRLATLAAAP